MNVYNDTQSDRKGWENMKKIIAWLLVVALTAAISIGATLAYLTDTDEDVNVMTLGKVKIDQLEYERVNDETANEKAEVQEFHDNKPLYPAVTENGFDYTPGDTYVDWTQIGKDGYTTEIWNPEKINNELDKMVFIKNKGDYDAFVRTVFAFEAGNYKTLDQFKSMMHLNLNETNFDWEWIATPVTIGESTYFIATATYNQVLAPGALTEISLSQIALDKTATNEDVEAFGDTYQILVKSQGIQADGFADPATALNEGFGAIAADNIPWENDAATKGIGLKKAVQYLDGGSTKIAGSVVNVTFGLNKDYPDIVNNYTGTLVDVEQDLPAYAYYVKSGTTYDVYVLSNGAVYAPANSKNLFASMGKLKTVKGNLDVSRVVDMESMFDYCGALQSVDCAQWDTGNVTDMQYMFYGCGNLTNLDVSGWDMSNVTTLNQTFYGCKKLTALDVADWDLSNMTFLYGAFYNCASLTALDVSDWDTSKVTNISSMFSKCSSLTEVDVADWNVGKVTGMSSVFSNCTALTSLSAPNWNVSSVTTMKDMFRSCSKLATVDLSGWKPSNVTDMTQMFLSCSALTGVDMANWDVSKVQSFSGMFGYDGNLQTVKTDHWNPVSATSFLSMFHDCTKLQGFNAKGWQLPNLLTSSHMFRGCNSATFIDVSGWYTPSLTSMDGMFHTCKALTEVDLSSFDTSNCTELSQIFDHATGIKRVKGLEKWDTSNCRTFEETFAGCSALEELDLSSFNTRNVENAFYPMQNNATGYGFRNMFSNMSNKSLKKLVIGADFSFDGDGKVTDADNKVTLPNPGPIDGQATKWYNEANDTYYDASEIPEEIAAVYVAKVPPVNP